MKNKLLILLAILLVLLAIFLLQTKSSSKRPRESLEENIDNLTSTGEITSDQVEFVKLQLAIVDYIAIKHSPPESLKLLVPKYFNSIPINPKTKKPFQYEKIGDGYRILDEMTEVASISAASSSPVGLSPSTSPGAGLLNPNNLAIEDFVYSPEGKRDPFQPFDLAPKVSLDENLPPLERYDVSQLKVSAILSDTIGGMVAIVEDATGRGYTVKVGTKVGNKNGSVVSIDGSQVNVLENVTTFTGEIKQDLRSIKLQKAPEEKQKPSKSNR